MFVTWEFWVKIAGALTLVGLIVFADFIFGPKTLLFSETGSDSLNDYYPIYVLLSDYLRHVGIPSWSFRAGMGQSMFLYVGYLFLAPVVWLPKAAIAKALVYQHLGYVFIAGMAFARFLANRGLRLGSCLLGTLLLSFSAYMCAGSCWYSQAAEVACLTVLLLASELAIDRGRWHYVALAIFIVGILGSFQLYLGALLLCTYVPFRLLERYSWRPLWFFGICGALALAALIGLGLSAIVSIDNLYALMSSPRGSGLTSMFDRLSSLPAFGLDRSLTYITAALRPFSNDMLGTEDHFRGWYNYFEAPMSYCGLLCLLIFPQVFVGATWRHRALYAVFIGATFLPIVFPWFRYLFWAFQGEYFRTFSLFSVFGIITLSMTVLSLYTEGRRLNLWVLGATGLILTGVLYLPLKEVQEVINPSLRVIVVICLLVYAILLTAGQILRRQKIAAWIIIILSVAELIYLNRITISARHSLTKEKLNERKGYNDETVDAVRDIKAKDDSFFRITKTWGSSPSHAFPSLNDAMVFGYNGTSSYSSFNNVNYIKFLMAVDTIAKENADGASFWSTGLLGYPLLSTFACEKYVLAGDPIPYQTADYYVSVGRYGDFYLFRNEMFLPLGLVFDHYLSEDVFLQMPPVAKTLSLLHVAVLSEEAATSQPGLNRLKLEELKQRMRDVSIPEVISSRRATAFDTHIFTDTRIRGTAGIDGRSLLVMQTPFDSGWHAYQDGQPAPVLKVDVGLLGVVLDNGRHEVELRYRPPFLIAGAAVSFASLLILAIGYWWLPRMPVPEAKDRHVSPINFVRPN